IIRYGKYFRNSFFQSMLREKGSFIAVSPPCPDSSPRLLFTAGRDYDSSMVKTEKYMEGFGGWRRRRKGYMIKKWKKDQA
ncbi:MAG: hypothetical protein J6X53_06485, partial [Abditibacteriota bacterium]|nr:hypothetical protein [Abditibacteriota bacterium]